MKQIIALIIVLCSLSCMATASCPQGDDALHKQGIKEAIPLFETCALQLNDDETQLYLAQLYERGQVDVPKNISRALLFYHLSAENGNASAQVGLSKLLTLLDENDETRAEIRTYLDKIQGMLLYRAQTSFQGQLLHPYTLLLLAAEKPESKWFYPTKTKTDRSAAGYLKQYKITPEKQANSYAEASSWKQRKMMDIARDVFSDDEFEMFRNRIYPSVGRADAFVRTQAVQDLKDKLSENMP